MVLQVPAAGKALPAFGAGKWFLPRLRFLMHGWPSAAAEPRLAVGVIIYRRLRPLLQRTDGFIGASGFAATGRF